MKPRTLLKHIMGASGEVLDWGVIQKSQFIYAWIAEIAIWLAILLAFITYASVVPIDGLHKGHIEGAFKVILAVPVVSLIAFAIGFKLPPTARSEAVYSHICIQFYVAINVILAYYTGIFSVVAGIAFAGGSITGFILFPSRVVFAGLITGAVASAGLLVLSAFNAIEYAPLLDHNAGEAWRSPAWQVLIVGICLPYLGLLISMNSSAIRRWQAREAEVLFLSSTDPLTGVANRRQLLERLDLEIRRAIRLKAPLSVLMVDIDHFKVVNDDYGHLCGDEALRCAARIFEEQTRDMDLVGRYGGEEFAIVLPNTSSEEALPIAERCRQALEQTPVDCEDGTRLSLTASIGLASLIESDENADHILARADEVLYLAKEQGRNRVMSA
ncbi:MAG: GGDEF domain-containing protein [Pseudomonadota bacterium]